MSVAENLSTPPPPPRVIGILHMKPQPLKGLGCLFSFQSWEGLLEARHYLKVVEYKATKEAPLLGIDVLLLLYIRLPTT